MKDFLKLRADYKDLLLKITDRAEGVRRLNTFLMKNTLWEEVPESRRGDVLLLEHSINVAQTLLRLASVTNPEIPQETLVIVGLFHDISKLGGFVGEVFYPRLVKKGSVWVYNEMLSEIAFGARSLYIISRFISLNEQEVQAIVSSEGLYNNANDYMRYKEGELSLLLHWSDYYVSHILEKPGHYSYKRQEPWSL